MSFDGQVSLPDAAQQSKLLLTKAYATIIVQQPEVFGSTVLFMFVHCVQEDFGCKVSPDTNTSMRVSL